MARDAKYIAHLERILREGLQEGLGSLTLNGSEHARYRGITNISFAGVEGESLLMALKDLAVSSGSACTRASLEPSYVLRALEKTVKHVNALRDLSPLWEMMQEGIDLK